MQAYPFNKLASTLKKMLTPYSRIYLDSAFTTIPKRNGPFHFLNDENVTKTDLDFHVDFLPSKKRKLLAPEVAKLRRIKSKAEIELMRKAADISATAHAKVRPPW